MTLLLGGDGNGSARRLYPVFVRPALPPPAPPGGSLLAALGTLTGLNSPAAPLALLADAHREEELVRLAAAPHGRAGQIYAAAAALSR